MYYDLTFSEVQKLRLKAKEFMFKAQIDEYRERWRTALDLYLLRAYIAFKLLQTNDQKSQNVVSSS